MARKNFHRRFIRSPIPPKYKYQPRHTEILKLLAEYRYLDTYQIQALLPRELKRIYPRTWRPQRPQPTWIPTADQKGKFCWEAEEAPSQRVVELHLQFLFHDHFTDKPPKQRNALLPSLPDVHSLGTKGIDKLVKEGFPKERIEWHVKNWHDANRTITRPNVDHTLGVSNFRGSLNLALQSVEKAQLILWLQGSMLKVEFKAQGRPMEIKPDGFFIAKHGTLIITDFHEYVNTMEPTPYLEKKLQPYWQFWKQGGHQRLGTRLRAWLKQRNMLGEIESKLGQKFEINEFRVWTVASTEKRMENLRNMAKQADDRKHGSPMFPFTFDKCGTCYMCKRIMPKCKGCEATKKDSPQFKCAVCQGMGTQSECTDCAAWIKLPKICVRGFHITNPQNILNPIWQTPQNDKYHRLLD